MNDGSAFVNFSAPDLLQKEIKNRGLEIFARMNGGKSGLFNSVTGRLMDWSMRNEALKTQLFRLVDVLPTLNSSREVARHAQEYLSEVNDLPAPLRFGLKIAPKMPWLARFAAQRGVAQMGRTFILARDGQHAIPALREMRRQRRAFTVDLLGETAVSETEAAEYEARYLELIESLSREASKWPRVGQMDCDDHGNIPTVNISVKLSALYSQVHPADPKTAVEKISGRLRPLLLAAKQRGVFINLDMESTALKAVTIEVFKTLLDEPELRDYAYAGIAMQAYLRDGERDLEALIDWARDRKRRITVRLIKGAYWDYETILAGQREWPCPVFEYKSETDANYEKLAHLMLENNDYINCAFATHNVRSAAACMVYAERLGLDPRAIEFQMLKGMAEPVKVAIIDMGYRLREYCPVGEVLPGMSYLVRRLLENTSNEGFLRATFNEHIAHRTLLQDPATVVHGGQVRAANSDPQPEERFHNEPLTDFTLQPNRKKMSAALDAVRQEFGKTYPLIIGGKEIWGEGEILSINPAVPSQVIARVAKANQSQAEAALQAARDALPKWKQTPIHVRAGVLERSALIMAEERFSLAALEVFETGKPWMEADADIAEAIDFCRYYSREMQRLAPLPYRVPGETSLHEYIPRGVAVVIAPWNFPLAILCGMSAAALVTGNTVIMKPSEQSSAIAARLMNILQRAGAPAGTVNFLPGPGGDVGSYLVNHPDVNLIAFTGSREVGLKIFEAAGRVVPGQKLLKHAVCEMGGKNALIIDSDADVDEAIPAVIYSAFGYQGQKCSALSRLIILQENYDRVLERLIAACADLRVGPPDEPGTLNGPVIDKDSRDRILRYIEIGKSEGKLVFQGKIPDDGGYYVPPTIFADVPPTARIAREEIFGPLLSVFKARDLDEAIALANSVEYALTAGIFSRSPENIDRARRELEAGNVYINRGITGALVGRHPFGGYKMSGGGTKAGGRDYLLQFMLPRCVTENNMRRGFAPENSASE